jgi:mannose-6-phosphate isomerase-like protein (cupin superfamily)
MREAGIAVVAALALLLGACAHTPAPRCPKGDITLARDTEVIELLRVRTGPDGKSYGEMVPLAGTSTRYLGMVLWQFGLGDPSNVVIVNGPPLFQIPMHAAPYREIFLVLSGSSTVQLSGGSRFELLPGSMVLFEDVTGAGHGGKVGPCGYVSVDLQFKPPPASSPTH